MSALAGSPSVQLRSGDLADLSALYALNRLCFAEYWSLASLHGSLESGYDLLLAEDEYGMMTGYILSMSILDEIEIMQVAVHPDYRRTGLAQRLSRHLIDHSSGICTISLEVRPSNHAARQLYEGLGFVQTGYRKQYYAPNDQGICEDAIMMALQL